MTDGKYITWAIQRSSGELFELVSGWLHEHIDIWLREHIDCEIHLAVYL